MASIAGCVVAPLLTNQVLGSAVEIDEVLDGSPRDAASAVFAWPALAPAARSWIWNVCTAKHTIISMLSIPRNHNPM